MSSFGSLRGIKAIIILFIYLFKIKVSISNLKFSLYSFGLTMFTPSAVVVVGMGTVHHRERALVRVARLTWLILQVTTIKKRPVSVISSYSVFILSSPFFMIRSFHFITSLLYQFLSFYFFSFSHDLIVM